MQLSHLCSLRSPDRKRGKIRRSCPTETRARQNGRQARESADIKVLTDLRILLGPACYRHAGPYGPEEGAFSAVAPSLRDAPSVLRWRVFFCCLKQDLQDEQDEQDEGGLGAAQRLWMQRQEPL